MGRVMPVMSTSWNASLPICSRRHLAGEDHQGHRVQVGRGDPGHAVGGAGAGCGDDNAHLARGPGIAVGGVHRPLLMPGEDELEGRIVQGVEYGDDHAARVAEHALDLLFFQAFNDYVCALHLSNILHVR